MMPARSLLSVIFVLGMACATLPVRAADGQVTITNAKAQDGNVTPGDDEGYPVTISSPGSYILAGNLSPGTGLDAIVVEAPDVTIDLNGFRISGGPAGGASNARIGINAKNDRLTVKNGTIGAFKLYGIYAFDRSYLVVEHMRVVNGTHGIYNKGFFGRIQNNTVATNSGIGLFCDRACLVEGNIVSGNRDAVIINSGTVLGNAIVGNATFGLVAPVAGTGALPVGYGNNTLVDNNGGGAQTKGQLGKLHPNVCSPVAC